MVRVEVDISRPWSMLFWTSAVIVAMVYYNSGTEPSAQQQAETVPPVQAQLAEGGTEPQAVQVQAAEEDAKQLRMRQEVLSRREDILRGELAQLQSVRTSDPAKLERIQATREHLTDLLLNKRAAEEELTRVLEQMWEAQGFAMRLSREPGTSREVKFIWPAEPMMGISAYFKHEDDGYQERFGFPHEAIDIPMPQGSVVRAAADGIIAKVSDNGLGYNSLVIKHTNGMATLYGHVSAFLVTEGDEVHAGEAVALSGGEQGEPGTGRYSTGPHLHFQTMKDGGPVDPLLYLPDSGGA